MKISPECSEESNVLFWWCNLEEIIFFQNLFFSLSFVRLEALASVTMKSVVFWNITRRSLVKVTDASEEHIALVFRVEKQAKQDARREASQRMSIWGSISRR
jgi:hypothetical protein